MHLKIEILHKGSMISQMKTAGSKKYNLCMQERIHLFYDMGHVERSKHLINKNLSYLGSFRTWRAFYGY